MIKVEKICKKYISKEKEIVALDNVEVEFGSKGLVFLLGKSGSGKTTMLNVLSGLDVVDSGSVTYTIDGEDKCITTLSENEMDELRNIHIGFIFQEYHLIDNWNVRDNVVIALKQQSGEGRTEKEIIDKLTNILEYVGLSGMEKRTPHKLSGGQAQRVAIARALIKEPSVIFADEPTGNLDSKNGAKIFELLKEISKKCLVIVVSHDEQSAFQYGDRIIRMADGCIVDDLDNENIDVEYEVTIEDCENSKKQKLVVNSVEKVKEYLCNSILLNGKERNKYIFDITKKKIEQIALKEEKEKKDIKIKKIDYRQIIMFALNNLKLRKIRLAITIGIFAIALCFLQVLLQLCVADIGKAESKYLLKEQDSIFLMSSILYTNDFYDETVIERGDTAEILEAVKNYWDAGEINGCRIGVEIAGDKNNHMVVLLSTETPSEKLIYGSEIKECNDIYITDLCAAMLGLGNNAIGYKLEMLGAKFNVCGIIDTDYEQYDIINKLQEGKATPNDIYNYEYKYAKVFCSKEIISFLEKNATWVRIGASDFTATSDTYYIDSTMIFGNANSIKKEDILICGRYPEKENEVVISYDFACMKYLTHEGQLNIYMDIEYRNIYDEKYNNAYKGKVNMYDILDGVEIVGVVEPSEKTPIDVWLYSDEYEKVEEAYLKNFYNMYELSIENKSYEELRSQLNILYEEGIYVEEPVARQIQEIYEYRDELIFYGIILVVVFVLLTMLLNVSFMSYSVADNQRKVGILRALGISKRTVSDIFVYEGVIVSVVAYVISLVCSIIVVGEINNYFMQAYDFEATLFYHGIPIILTVFVFAVLLGILSVTLPITSMSKHKPVKLIKG